MAASKASSPASVNWYSTSTGSWVMVGGTGTAPLEEPGAPQSAPTVRPAWALSTRRISNRRAREMAARVLSCSWLSWQQRSVG